MVVKAAGFVIYRIVSMEVQFLLLQTSYGTHHWTPPKGHVDKGESDFDAAVREVEEESGFKLSELRVIEDYKKTVEYNVKDWKKVVIYWLAELINKDTPVKMSSEHRAYKWLPVDEASELSGFKVVQELLEDCQKFIDSKQSHV